MLGDLLRRRLRGSLDRVSMIAAGTLLGAVVCVDCRSPADPSPTPTDDVEVFEGKLDAAAPSFSARVSAFSAGPWRADLAHANLRGMEKAVELAVHDGSGAFVTRGRQQTIGYEVAQWEGGPGAAFVVTILLADPSDLVLGELFTLQVKRPLP